MVGHGLGGHVACEDGSVGDPVLGDQLDLLGLGSVTAITSGSGVVNLLEISLDPSAVLDAQQAAAFTLASLSFVAVGPGSTTLGLTVNSLGAADATPLTADIRAASVRVTAAVAAPASLVLLAVGLAGLGVSRLGPWRRRSSRGPVRTGTSRGRTSRCRSARRSR